MYAWFILVLFSMVECGRWQIPKTPVGGSLKLSVSSSFPRAGASNVPLNIKPTVVFGVPIDPSSLNSSSFFLKQGSKPIPVVITSSTLSASLTPTQSLLANTKLTATVSPSVKSLANTPSGGQGLAEAYSWTFTTGTSVDNTQPLVSSTFPLNQATNVSLNDQVSVVFSKSMDPSTVNNLTFFLESGNDNITGTVTYAGITADFLPTTLLASNTTYRASISSGATDLEGNFVVPFSWTFTTGGSQDSTQGKILASIPAPNSTGVALNLQASVSFSKWMDLKTVNNSTFAILDSKSHPVPGNISFLGTSVMFSPSQPLNTNSLYIGHVSNGPNGVLDLAGNQLSSSYTWTFTTGTASDNSLLKVQSTNPATQATLVCLQQGISISFNKPINGATVSPMTFQVSNQKKQAVSGTLGFNEALDTITFLPYSNLPSNSTMTAILMGGTEGVQDLTMNVLPNNFLWVFTTGNQNCSE